MVNRKINFSLVLQEVDTAQKDLPEMHLLGGCGGS